MKIFEKDIIQSHLKEAQFCIGADEVGRGPLAGPVVACAVSIDVTSLKNLGKIKKLGVTDSKQLNSNKRIQLLTQLGVDLVSIQCNKVQSLTELGLKYVVSELDAEKIDEVNIHHASLMCMKNAVKLLLQKSKSSLVLFDGKFTPHLDKKDVCALPVIKGDSKSILIGLASIIAKEFRDSKMKNFSNFFHGYGLEKHFGYPTPQHKKAIAELGPCPIHRKTFKGVKEHLPVNELEN